jgi:hypothetical protein
MPLKLHGASFRPEILDDSKPQGANLDAEWKDWIERDFGISQEYYSIDRGLGKIYRDCGWDSEGLQSWDKESFLVKREGSEERRESLRRPNM